VVFVLEGPNTPNQVKAAEFGQVNVDECNVVMPPMTSREDLRLRQITTATEVGFIERSGLPALLRAEGLLRSHHRHASSDEGRCSDPEVGDLDIIQERWQGRSNERNSTPDSIDLEPKSRLKEKEHRSR
jgi:hypothetical protein